MDYDQIPFPDPSEKDRVEKVENFQLFQLWFPIVFN